MNTSLKHEKWNAIVTPDDIKIEGFAYRPAQAQKITKLLGIANSMETMRVLPENIEDPPYTVNFSEDGGLVLIGDSGSLPLAFEDINDLIIFINDLVKVSIDHHRLRPHARGKVAFQTLPSRDGDTY